MKYDCERCIKTGEYKKRVCFLKHKEIELNVPDVTESSVREKSELISWERKKCTKEDVIKILLEVHKLLPNKLVHDVMRFPLMRMGLKHNEVCPMGLFDYDSNFYIELETAASKYHVLPYEGAYLDQPQDIIEAFTVIKAAEARYYNYQSSLIKQKSSESPNSSKSKRR